MYFPPHLSYFVFSSQSGRGAFHWDNNKEERERGTQHNKITKKLEVEKVCKYLRCAKLCAECTKQFLRALTQKAGGGGDF
jgi:hypothetical protein